MTDPRYPGITVELSDQDGNAFAIIGRVAGALRRAGVSRDDVTTFHLDATFGDYDDVLQTARHWVNVT